MSERFIPYNKLSKKRQRALDREKRGSWGVINPVTKRSERSDVYKRHKDKANNQEQTRRWHDDCCGGLYFA